MNSDTQFYLGLAIAVIAIAITIYLDYKNKQKTLLTAYLQFQTKIFADLDPELRHDLVINYKNDLVENLYQLQFVVKNNGNKPISNIIKPLQLILPNGYEVLDAQIIKIVPEGRFINRRLVANDIIEFDIPLLNRGEYFKLKLLLKGGETISSINLENELENGIKFTITAPGLDPILKLQTTEVDNNKISLLIPKSIVYLIFILLITSIEFSGRLLSKTYHNPSDPFTNTSLIVLFVFVFMIFYQIYIEIDDEKNKKIKNL